MAVAKPVPWDQVFTNVANVGSGWKIQTCEGGTDIDLASYTSATGGVANTNPIIADSAGRFDMWLTSGVAYDLILMDENDVVKDRTVNYVVGVGSVVTTSTTADIEFFYPDGPPSSADLLLGVRLRRATSFEANFSGSYGRVFTTNPAASFVITVKKNGATVGTITISTAGVFTFATSGGATVSCVAGDYLEFFGPNPADTQIADFGFTLAGTAS